MSKICTFCPLVLPTRGQHNNVSSLDRQVGREFLNLTVSSNPFHINPVGVHVIVVVVLVKVQ